MKDLEQFIPLKADITALVAPSLKAKVVDFHSSDDVIATTKRIKELKAAIDKKRRELTDPLRNQMEEINNYVHQITSPLNQAESHLRTELSKFAAEQERIRTAEKARIDAERLRKEAELREKHEREKRNSESVQQLFGENDSGGDGLRELQERQDMERISQLVDYKAEIYDANQKQIKGTRKTLKCTVINIDIVPKEFLIITVNEKMALAAHKGGKLEIPGLKFSYEVSVAIGQKTRVPRVNLESGG